MNQMLCRICEKELNSIDRMNIEVCARTLSEPQVGRTKTVDLFYCTDCRHLQIPYIFEDGFYDENWGYSLWTPPGVMRDYDRQLDILLAHYQNGITPQSRTCAYASDSLIIDIGCGVGRFLERARERFSSVLGIEPSIHAAKILEEKGLPHINGYFSREIMSDKMCDAFYSSQVFEHLENPVAVLQDIYKTCRSNAVGMIVVPDGQRNWINKEFAFILSDHANYYSPLSLMRLSYRAGFICEYCSIYDGKNIEMILRKPNDHLDSMTARRAESLSVLCSIPENKVVSAWGTGDKIYTYLPLIEKTIKISRLYDSNTCKHNKYIPGCVTKITKPAIEDIQKDDIIILFDTKYDEEIKNTLIGEFDFKGDFIVLV